MDMRKMTTANCFIGLTEKRTVGITCKIKIPDMARLNEGIE